MLRGRYKLTPALLSGAKYGRLTAVKFVEFDSRSNQKWLMQCDCGKKPVCYAFGVKNGRISSCGCGQKETAKNRLITHGMSSSREYKTWEGMIQRCTNPKATKFNLYGGRGIQVCERWMKFENFFGDMGVRPTKATLDRYPNRDGNYEPGNCRWATAKEQAANSRRSSCWPL